jgi:hypothetical protein
MAKNPNNDLPPEFIRSLLDYDPETGILRWKTRNDVPPKWNGRYAGKIAGTIVKGHISVRIYKSPFSAHRLIWVIMTGQWPDNDIDHEDTNGLNNRWDNLREATDSQNNFNRGPRRDNTTGFKGVTKRRTKKPSWIAQIVAHGKFRYLGTFPDPESAHAAYVAAAAELHGEFARSK